MTVQQPTPPAVHAEIANVPGRTITSTAAKALAALRIATGLIFVWASLDRTLGLHYATPSAKAMDPWRLSDQRIPRVGGRRSVPVAVPLDGWYLVGELAVHARPARHRHRLTAGVFMRIAASSGVVLVALMWLATFPIAQFTSAGEPTGSNNPIVDDHMLEALVLIVLALTYAGTMWGFGRRWARIPFVAKHRWAV